MRGVGLAALMPSQIQIIDPATARSIQEDAARTHPLFAWVLMRDLPDSPAAFVARLVTDSPTAYVLIGLTLAQVQAQLPSGLERTERQPSDPAVVVEVWFPAMPEADEPT
jgi:hypothetical protein